MPIELTNERVSLVFHLPSEGYSGTRFSHIGKLVEVEFEGVSFTTTELNTGFVDSHGAGFYNEFDINTALGFDEVNKGEWFHKIGVGLLKKDSAIYDFFKPYEVRLASFEVASTKTSVSFRCVQEIQNGYAYELEQVYSLLDSGFDISCHLKNTGEKSIQTEEYNHNFLQIQRNDLGANYQLKFKPNLSLSENSELVNPKDVFSFSSSELSFNAAPESDIFLSDLASKTQEKLSWELQHSSGYTIQGATNIPSKKLNIWGARHVISPELFIDVLVKPGEVKSWKRSYHFNRLV